MQKTPPVATSQLYGSCWQKIKTLVPREERLADTTNRVALRYRMYLMPDLPLLLLDVDGVLVPVGSGDGEEMESADYGRLFHARALPSRLAALSKVFRLVWATGWNHEANEKLCPLFGLPPLPVIEFWDETFKAGTTWKLAAVKRFVKDRPFAWLDDELGVDAHRWARRRETPTLLVDVRADRGLTQDHVDVLLRFARSTNLG